MFVDVEDILAGIAVPEADRSTLRAGAKEGRALHKQIITAREYQN